jgi:hypothetical protein
MRKSVKIRCELAEVIMQKRDDIGWDLVGVRLHKGTQTIDFGITLVDDVDSSRLNILDADDSRL